jgi:hypothetical protein
VPSGSRQGTEGAGGGKQSALKTATASVRSARAPVKRPELVRIFCIFFDIDNASQRGAKKRPKKEFFRFIQAVYCSPVSTLKASIADVLLQERRQKGRRRMATAQRPQQQTAVHVLTHELSFPEAPTHVSYPLTEEFDEELCSDYLARARYTRLFPARISLVPETWVLSCYRVNDSLPVPVVTATVAPAHARTPVVRVDTDAFTNLYPPQQVGWLSELVFC